MAEAASPSTNTRNLCRFFANGVCRFGASCRFSHDRQTGRLDNTCRYYLAGNCSYGSRCRYDHVRPEAGISGSRSNLCESPSIASQSSITSTTSPPSSGARAKNYGRTSSWADAREFVPSFTDPSRIHSNNYNSVVKGMEDIKLKNPSVIGELCPFYSHGGCPYGVECEYVHGEECELCGKSCLHPSDQDQRKSHHAECMKVLEDDMKLSFAISLSNEKVCGICMEVVMEKTDLTERRFGILTGCNHVYCLNCIREWRARKEFKHKVVRACPECRIHSDFVVPSPYWYEDVKEKEKMISEYKTRLSKKSCKYFNKGQGKCPFGSVCFYQHAYHDGSLAKNEEPPKPRPRRVRTSRNTLRSIQESLLWDFLTERENRGDGLSTLFELDDDFLIRLMASIGEADLDSDDTSSYGDFSDFVGDLSDEYYDTDDSSDEDDDNDNDYANISSRVQFAFM